MHVRKGIFHENSGLIDYKKTFIRFIDRYTVNKHVHPSVHLIQGEHFFFDLKITCCWFE